MFQQGDFIVRTPKEADARRRKIMAMLPRFGSAQYTGQGLAHLASGILGGQRLRGLEKKEESERERANGLFADIMSGEAPRNPDPWMTAMQIAALRKKK